MTVLRHYNKTFVEELQKQNLESLTSHNIAQAVRNLAILPVKPEFGKLQLPREREENLES